MKKVILVVAMVFATGSFVNANTSEVSENPEDEGCAEKAWDYGTANGGGDADKEYELTEAYYSGCSGS
ncbi:hypothetical protein G1K75_08610 [Tenacibaculum finnmarkense]|uniref:hypothetical protein n=1 Tax=Tenacibaculum finnmarkense TaxID=2781243 RepID=UPI00187B2071|nr:hypothetical protein [Tenacibaculum finnmarkense]MBE7692058.1 hypothetical protein [Tenacibaculum finnmarkense genomovar finnmarkense]MCD8402426.1 hypothetical protein [Tenacibaculum finnmarkense genomovar finnmarkense]MCD8446700.1 hypothetical protein [Tenacibaculum finnmarkense genomovar finnmarkense]MCD8453725.1 hypothetical protein [Tenacibaculum finnmarkense genomovar ulcerans]MCG8805717.1 hypothetical protein [Tenacibaculum finnmarkense]